MEAGKGGGEGGFQMNNQFAGKILTSRWTTDGPNSH